MLYALLGGVFCSWVVSFTIINGNILPVMSLIALKPLFPSWHSKLLRSLAHAGRYLSCRQSVPRQAQTRLTIPSPSFPFLPKSDGFIRGSDFLAVPSRWICHSFFPSACMHLHTSLTAPSCSSTFSGVSDPINITHHHTCMHIDSRRHDQLENPWPRPKAYTWIGATTTSHKTLAPFQRDLVPSSNIVRQAG